ncbi:uncharacterized protein [Centruroides vittatus]|uniref:uncharacterized protein n=1 Tax=Centruroides vittatus TaxID=120091 RepID=UPI00350FFA24
MVVSKATKASNALFSIAKNTWGIGYKAAKYIYLGAIEPILLYAAPIWAEAAQKVHIQRKLSKAQRIAALRICRAYRTAPTSALLVIAGLLPVHIKAKMAARIWNINKLGTSNYLCNTNKINTMLSDLPEQVKEDIKSYGIEVKDANSNMTVGYSTISSYTLPHDDTCDISIYTDGSKNNENVGAAFVLINHQNGDTHKSAFKLGPHCSVPQAEILAITKAIDYVFTDWFPRNKTIIVYTDSITAIHYITGLRRRSDNVPRIHRHLASNTHNHNVHFKWVRGHSGVAGNEAADSLAKSAAASSLPSSYDKIPPSKIKYWNFQLAIHQWQQEWDSSITGRTTYNFIPNITQHLQWRHFSPSFAMTQLLTGHGNFKAYLKRFHILEDNICQCDGTSIQDSSHFLFDCTLFNQNRDTLIGSVLYAGFNWPCPFNVFLENKDIYYKLADFLSATAALNPASSLHTANNSVNPD